MSLLELNESELQAVLDALSNQINGVRDDVDNQAATIAAYAQLLATHSDAINALNARVTALESGEPRTFFVAPDGNDSADGSAGYPWLTWNRASLSLAPGDTLILLPGTHIHFLDDTGSEHKIIFAGEPDRPITIRGDGAIIQYVSLEGQGGVLDGITGRYLFNRCNHVTLRNCTFDADSNLYNVITLYHDHHHITIDGCELSGATRSGIDVLGVSDVVIRNCHIHHTARGIQIKKGALDVLVEGCDIHDFTDGAIMGLGTTCTGDCQVTGSAWVRDPDTPILERYQAKNVIVENNRIHHGHSWTTVRLGGWRDYTFIHNEFHDLDMDSRLSHVIRVDSQHWEFKDATALAYTPHRDCDPPCTSAECNRIILHSGQGGVIQYNTLRDFGGATLLKVVEPCDIPDMDYNVVSDSAYSLTGPRDAYDLHGVEYAPDEVPDIEGNTIYS